MPVLGHMPRHVLRHLPSRHVPDRHVLNHVLRHMPDKQA